MASSSRSEKRLVSTTLVLLRERISPLSSFCRASSARFFFSICWTSARNSSERIEISGVLMPAAARMSTISVETTARIEQICWMAKSRGRPDSLPASLRLGQRGAHGLEEADLVADRAGLVAGGGQREGSGQAEHGVLIAPVRLPLAFVGRLAGRASLLAGQHPFDRPGQHAGAAAGRARKAAGM